MCGQASFSCILVVVGKTGEKSALDPEQIEATRQAQTFLLVPQSSGVADESMKTPYK